MKKRQIDTRAIVMLLFGLVAVILIMLQLRRSMPKPPPELARLAGRIGIVDSTIVHRPLHFMLKMPSNVWHPTILSKDTSFVTFRAAQPVLDQIAWLANCQRAGEDTASARIGVLRVAEPPDSHELAITVLAELLDRYEINGRRVAILQPVTSPAHQVLKGDYFAVKLPAVNGQASQILVVALLPRGNTVFVIQSQTTEQAYPQIRDELQDLVRRFYPLPSTLH